MIHIKAPKLLGIISKTINGLCVFNLLLYRDELNPTLINHEEIHWEQYKELFLIGFLFLYFYYHFKVGYRQNPFEQEAYNNEHDLEYKKTRKPYAWKEFR